MLTTTPNTDDEDTPPFSPFPPMFFGGGHYDNTGRWVQDKFCLVSCYERCDCQPPNGVYQLPKPMIQPVSEEAKALAKKVVRASKTRRPSPKEAHEWATRLVNDVKDAND